jgi:hypothetical protein
MGEEGGRASGDEERGRSARWMKRRMDTGKGK